MIWILAGLLACGKEPAQVEKQSPKEAVEIKIEKKETPAEKETTEVKTEPIKSKEQPKENQNSGEIHTQIGQKNVDIKYENMEDIKGIENGKKIQGLDIKIGNMNIKVDEVEIENLKVEKK